MRLLSGRRRAAVVPLVLVLACLGCSSEGDTGAGEPTGDATNSGEPSSSVEPTFFTWQQTEVYGDLEAEVAESARAANYFLELMMRDWERSRSELRSVTTEHIFTQYGGKVSQLGPQSRGPVTVRLMQVQVDDGESWAVASWCTDNSEIEIKNDGEQWQERDEGSYSVFSHEFIPAESSPTGWRLSHFVDDPISTDDCARSFENQEPAVDSVGPEDP